MTTNILITCPTRPVLIDKLSAAEVSIEHRADIDYDQLMDIIADYDIIVVSTSIDIDKALIDKATRLKIIGRLGSGLDHIDTVAARDQGILILSTPQANSRAVAEHVLGMILSHQHHICRAQHEVKQGLWRRTPNTGIEILDKKIGIIGYGNNGSLTAKLLSDVGMQVSVYDPYVEYLQVEGITFYTDIKSLLADIDFLSFHVPLTSETHHYFSAELTRHLTRPLTLINISRGEVVDTAHLLAMLESHTVTSALLDVIENERAAIHQGTWPATDPLEKQLRSHPRVLITPHIAGYSHESKEKMSSQLADKILNNLGSNKKN